MNYINDPTFQNVRPLTKVYNDNRMISPSWWIKTQNGAINCIVTKHDGIKIDARYPNPGYLYVRQIIPNVKQFSGKKYILKADVTRDSWQELKYDVYIRARLTADDNVPRPFVIDTPEIELRRGLNKIEVPFVVPDLSGYTTDTGEGLTTALRFIGDNQNTSFHVNKIEVIEVVEEEKLTQTQYDAICDKIKELM